MHIPTHLSVESAAVPRLPAGKALHSNARRVQTTVSCGHYYCKNYIFGFVHFLIMLRHAWEHLVSVVWWGERVVRERESV